MPPAVTPQCDGTVTLVDADSLAFSGGQLAAGASDCTIDVTVLATGGATGILTNQTSIVTSAEGVNSRGTAQATVNVLPAPGAPSIPAENFPCVNLATQTDGALTGQGGIGNVGLTSPYGNSYCHVINMDGTYLPDEVVGSAEIGEPGLIALGVVQAVDVFGLLPGGFSESAFNSPVTVSLRGTGDVYFISSVNHSIQQLPAVQNGGYLCVTISEAGKVLLVGGSPNLNAPLPENVAPASRRQSR